MARFLSADVSERALGAARIAVGMSAAAKAGLLGLTAPGLVSAEPYLPALGSGGLRPLLPDGSVAVLLLTMAVFGVLLALGPRARISATVVTLCTVILLLVDARLWSNHLLLLALLAAGLALAGGGHLRADPSRTADPLALLLCTQITVVYLFAGLSKVNPAFLSGEVLRGEFPNGLLSSVALLQRPTVAVALSIGAVAGEIMLAVGLWSRRTRKPAVALGIAMHLAFIAMVAPWHELVVFAAMCVGTYPLFLSLRIPASDGAEAQRAEPMDATVRASA